MTTAAAPVPSATPPYVVDTLTYIGNGLWQITVLLPSRTTVRIVIAFNNLTLQSVILSAAAVGALADTNDGAEPLLRPFR